MKRLATRALRLHAATPRVLPPQQALISTRARPGTLAVPTQAAERDVQHDAMLPASARLWARAISTTATAKAGGARSDAEDRARELLEAVEARDWTTARRCGLALATGAQLASSEVHAVEELLRVLARLPRTAGREMRTMAEATVAVCDALREAGHPLSVAQYTNLVLAYGRLGRTSEARGAFRAMQREGHAADTRAYNILLAAHRGDAGELREALSFFGEMRRTSAEPTAIDHRPDVVTYNTLIALAAKAGELTLAEELREDMPRAQVHPDAYTYAPLVLAYTKQGRAAAARRTFNLMRQDGVVSTAYMWNQLIDMYARLGQSDDALAAYATMTQLSPAVQPDNYTYVSLIQACAALGQVDKAEQLFLHDMPTYGVTANVYTYGAMMDAYLRANRPEDAERLAMQLEKDADVEANAVIYSIRIRARAMLKQGSAVEQLFREMQAKGIRPDALAYAAVIEAYADQDNMEAAVRMFEEMNSLSAAGKHGAPSEAATSRALLPTSVASSSIAAHLALIRAFLRTGDMPAAAAVYQGLRETGISLNTWHYNALLSAFMTGDHADQGQRVLDDMRQEGVPADAYTYSILFDAYGQQSDIVAVYHTHRLLAVDYTLDPDAAVWNALMNGYQRCRQPVQVVQIWRQLTYGIGDGTEPPVPAGHDAKQASAADKTAESNDALEHRPPRRLVDEATVSIMLDTCGRFNYSWLAQDLWRRLPALGVVPNANNYTSYVECLARLGQYDEALAVLVETPTLDSAAASPPADWPSHKTVRTLAGLLTAADRPTQLDQLTTWVEKHRPELVSALQRPPVADKLVVEHLLQHIERLSTALAFSVTCRRVYNAARHAEGYWRQRYYTHFKLSELAEEIDWVDWQRRRHAIAVASGQRLPRLTWFSLVCRRGALEANWRAGHWRTGGVRVRALTLAADHAATQSAAAATGEQAEAAEKTTSAATLPQLRLVGQDRRFLLVADDIRHRLLVVEPALPARNVECQQPSDWEAAWPPSQLTVALGDQHVAMGVAAATNDKSAPGGIVYLWRLRDGQLLRRWPVDWPVPSITLLGYWMLVQAAVSAAEQSNVFRDAVSPDRTSALESASESVDASYAVAYDISGEIEDDLETTADRTDKRTTSNDGGVVLRRPLRLNVPRGRTRYVLLPSIISGLVEVVAYQPHENMLHWTHMCGMQDDSEGEHAESSSTADDRALKTRSGRKAAANESQEATMELNSSWVDADMPLQGDIECWPLIKHSMRSVRSMNDVQDEDAKSPSMLLVGSYSQTATQQYFFVGAGSDEEDYEKESDELLQQDGSSESGGEGSSNDHGQTAGLDCMSSRKRKDCQPKEPATCSSVQPASSSAGQIASKANHAQQRRRRHRPLRMMEPTWIGVHSLASGSMLWQRVIRAECRGRILPLPSREMLVCSFSRGVMLINMVDGTNLRVFRAAGGRLAPGPQHAIGRYCAVWAADGRSAFFLDLRRDRVPRRAVPVQWANALSAVSQQKQQRQQQDVNNAKQPHRHLQLAIGTAFLAMVHGDAIRWLYFGAELEPTGAGDKH
ncbi:hypothetical protein THASP1DRAFT_31677 [Thamnocephalis sphaerospora]|uniref:Pentacotripeptide-repeat region of PRORP domain-containing protein n=1 Tax=Thamnocephalis sphaerospora TaxID=78915 RepID=A0A4P9XL41_9FUNG|nr:hypothetical protein THASP1DRAFT_31677 [Thamnocephalis sphaerospora]|eukprot:RKP06505.1 hypothetical protein THASP1DRAFT_31677 [Thamnocephalis sphaerospora]